MSYTNVRVCDIITDETLSTHATLEEGIDAASNLRKNGNFNVKLMVDLEDGQKSRRQKIAERETATRARRSQIQESGREFEDDEVHVDGSNNSSSSIT